MKKNVTIKEVAAYAGVAPSTVSYVLNGNRPIGDAVKQKVRKAVKKLNYRASYSAKMLKSSRTMNIGVAVGACDNPATARLLGALGKTIREQGYHMILGVAGNEKSEGDNILLHFESGVVDGVINLLPEMPHLDAVKLCRQTPVVTYGRIHTDSPVSIDYRSGISELLEYLLYLGHKKIGFVTCETRLSLENNYEDPCIMGAKIFYKSKGIPWDENLNISSNSTFESGQIVGEELYNRGATAIFGGNDLCSAGIMAWAHSAGVKIPDQLSVAGFDDAPIASCVFPQLTTIQTSYNEIAQFTFTGLLNKIETGDIGQVKISTCKLIIRNSCKALD